MDGLNPECARFGQSRLGEFCGTSRSCHVQLARPSMRFYPGKALSSFLGHKF